MSCTWSTVAGLLSAAVIRVPPSKSMPKFRPCTDIAIAQTSRITPDIEKNHFDLPMKSNRIGLESRAPSADLELQQARAAQREQDRLGRDHSGEQRQHDADAEGEREAAARLPSRA